MQPTHPCNRETERDLTHSRGDGDRKIEVETGAMWPQAKECRQPPVVGRGQEGPPLEPPEGAPADT